MILTNGRNTDTIIPMILTESEKKTIELFNPWIAGSAVELGIVRGAYLDTIDTILKNRRQILFILGSRRVGKTMILLQYIDRLIRNGISPSKILFLSLDNTNLQKMDLYTLLASGDYAYALLDEVHYFPQWAHILKSLYDLPGYPTKIVATGSSSTLIEDHKAMLTGRSTTLHVTPLSYREFGQFYHSNNLLRDYLYYGGYPEHVLERSPNYLNELLRDVIEKDVMNVHAVRNSQYLIDICQMIAKQVGHRGSPNKMAKVLGIDNKTAVNYVEYLREVHLVSHVYQYSQKLNERLYGPKKYYFCDLGMRNSLVGFVDIGALVENAVFLKLVQLYGVENIFYAYKEARSEVDFVVRVGDATIMLVESKYINLRDSVLNKLSTLLFRNNFYEKIIRRIVVTDGVNEIIEHDRVKIELIGLEQFLLQNVL